jgi:hypothetical protein
MKHIPKQQWMGCAVATAAMLSGRSYEEVATLWPDLDETRMRKPEEICSLLGAATDTPWRLAPRLHPSPPVCGFLPPPWPVAVWIQDTVRSPKFGLWIVVKDEVILDPGESTAHSLQLYPRRAWVVTIVAQPVRPYELPRLRSGKRLDELHSVLQSLVS